ncbi:hypothetical protein LINPERHAP1_LOCUS17450 [Linum perenne]
MRRIAATCWNIWKARNALIFRNQSPNNSTTAEAIAQDTSDWCTISRTPVIPTTSNSLSSRPQIHHTRPTTNPPPGTHLKVYCDGSFQSVSQMAAFGVVVTNSDGFVCDGRSGRFPSASPIASEARAILEAALFAASSPIHCVIHSDCLRIINSIRGPVNRWPWECYGTLGSITRVLRSCPHVTLKFIRRNLNFHADWVANQTRRGTLPPDWVELGPPNLDVRVQSQ